MNYCFLFISKPNDMMNFRVLTAVFQSYAFSSSDSSSKGTRHRVPLNFSITLCL